MHDLYIAKSDWLSFAVSSIGQSAFSFTHRAPKKLYRVRWCVTVVQGQPRSSNLVSLESQ